jgi:AraC-like DNA-binding protein
MTISLSEENYYELLQEIEEDKQLLGLDGFELNWSYPSLLGHGSVQEITLRDGLELDIVNYQLHDDLMINCIDREHPLEYWFNLADYAQNSSKAIPYCLYGSGISPGDCWHRSSQEHNMWVSVHIEPKVFQSLVGDSSGQIPIALQHLVREPDREYYARAGQATPAMQMALQQILQCPYQGSMKRLFLESKVLELMTLLLEHEIEAQQGKSPVSRLKPDDVDRLHQAKAILSKNLDNPPSLRQLARQVGLNECTLKQGFRLVFNTTVFGYLRQCRMEQAKLLLMQGRMSVYEAAQAVGYTSQSRFATVFRKTFGVNPKTFSMQRWQ